MTHAFSLLIVDDEPNLLLVLKDLLQEHFDVFTAASVREAVAALAKDPDLILCDLRLPDGSGLEVLHASQTTPSQPLCIMMTAHGDVPTAVAAMRDGAWDFILKPVADERLLTVLRHAAEKRIDAARIAALSGQRGSAIQTIVGASVKACELRDAVQRVARSDLTVLIQGETGTGKELVAQAIHELSTRCGGPFVTVNGATLQADLFESELFGHEKGAFTGAATKRRGAFEIAHGGTLFLDEIGELPLTLQAKLLRVLEDGKIQRVGSEGPFVVNVRVIAATNRDIEHDETFFRNDLFHRLSRLQVNTPALWERGNDVLQLAEMFLARACATHGRSTLRLSELSIAALHRYRFPGNVRELRNLMERAAVMTVGDTIEPVHLSLPENFIDDRSGIQTELDRHEADLIKRALEKHHWVQARAARELGIGRSHLFYKIRRLKIELPLSKGHK